MRYRGSHDVEQDTDLRFRLMREQLNNLQGLSPENQALNLALTVLFVPGLLDSVRKRWDTGVAMTWRSTALTWFRDYGSEFAVCGSELRV